MCFSSWELKQIHRVVSGLQSQEVGICAQRCSHGSEHLHTLTPFILLKYFLMTNFLDENYWLKLKGCFGGSLKHSAKWLLPAPRVTCLRG